MDADSRYVFLVHGRDTRATASMKDFLYSIDLLPIEWEEAVAWTENGSPVVIDVVRAAMKKTKAVVVLFTPDEEVRLRPHLLGESPSSQERETAFQSRPNVLIEAGMALAVFDHTIIVEIGEHRQISDLAGLHVIRFDGGDRIRKTLVRRLRNAGYDTRTDDDRYLSTGFAYLADPAVAEETLAVSATVGDLISRIEATQRAIYEFAWRWDQNEPSHELGRWNSQDSEEERQRRWNESTERMMRYGSQRIHAYAQDIEPKITDVIVRAKRILGTDSPVLERTRFLEHSGTNYITMREAAKELQAVKSELELRYR